MENSQSDDLNRRRAELEAGIEKCRAYLASIEQNERELAKQTALLRGGKKLIRTVAPLVKGAGKPRAAINRAKPVLVKWAADLAEAQRIVPEVKKSMQAMQAELDGLGKS